MESILPKEKKKSTVRKAQAPPEGARQATMTSCVAALGATMLKLQVAVKECVTF